jgi:hypothetical protein
LDTLGLLRLDIDGKGLVAGHGQWARFQITTAQEVDLVRQADAHE